MVDSNSPELAGLLDGFAEIHDRAERVEDAQNVVRDLAQTFIDNGMDASDVAHVLENVATSIKHYN